MLGGKSASKPVNNDKSFEEHGRAKWIKVHTLQGVLDSIQHHYTLKQCLKTKIPLQHAKPVRKLGLPETFVRYVEMLYNDPESELNLNGYITALQPSLRSRGVSDRGCPLSILLYVLNAEPLGEAIRTAGGNRWHPPAWWD